jgi:hypothetical protein
MGLTLYAVCAFAALPAFAQTGDPESYGGDTDDAVQVAAPTAQATDTAPQATTMASPVATASPEATAAAGPDMDSDANGALNPNDSVQDQVAHMENRVLAQQDQIRRLKDALAQVGADSNAQFGETLPEESKNVVKSGDMLFDVAGTNNNFAEETPLVWRRLSLLVNLDFEYTSQYNSSPAAGGIGTGNRPDFIQPSSPNGEEGMYFGHVQRQHVREIGLQPFGLGAG